MSNHSETTNILILYYSKQGHTKTLAHTIAQGVLQQPGANSMVAKIADINSTGEGNQDDDDLVASTDLLNNCDGIILGCPSWYGGAPAAVKYFWDKTTPQWLNGTLVDKPAAVFSSSNTMHGGNEVVLLNIMVPLLHHGMLITGNPYTEKALNKTLKGGSPYGASHVEMAAPKNNDGPILDAQEALLAMSLGHRVARLAQAIKNAT